jgi:putative aminopeptidase FrvX
MDAGNVKVGLRTQLEVLVGGRRMRRIQRGRQGSLQRDILPSRYVHSFSEVISKNDLEESIKLLVRLMEEKIPV